MNIRKADVNDLSRIAEIFIFNNRIHYFPIFQDEGFSFGELQVLPFVEHYLKKEEIMEQLYVLDDGLIRGFLQLQGAEICKLYVDPFFQGRGIGGRLIQFAVEKLHGSYLWALEKNVRAISFYERHGFSLTGERKFEEGTTEFLVKLAYYPESDFARTPM